MPLNKFGPGCACCDGVDNSGCPAPCVATAIQFTLSFPGIADGDCSTCEQYDATITLTKTPGQCLWTSADDPCGTGDATGGILMTYDGNNIGLSVERGTGPISSETIATYGVADSTWDCASSKTLSGGGVGTQCASWPATIQIDPV